VILDSESGAPLAEIQLPYYDGGAASPIVLTEFEVKGGVVRMSWARPSSRDDDTYDTYTTTVRWRYFQATRELTRPLGGIVQLQTFGTARTRYRGCSFPTEVPEDSQALCYWDRGNVGVEPNHPSLHRKLAQVIYGRRARTRRRVAVSSLLDLTCSGEASLIHESPCDHGCCRGAQEARAQ
jgi:hypothetical protein